MMTAKRLVALVAAAGLLATTAGTALAFNSGGTPEALGPDTIVWTGQGASDDGVLESTECPSKDALPDGIDANSYLHWILTTDGGEADTDAILHLGGTGSGSYATTKDSGGAFHFFTPYFTPDSSLTASADFTVLATGDGSWILTISHGCNGEEDKQEHLTVTKTADTSFDRTHEWDPAKKVETENGYTHNGYPKIWLYTDGHGDETATWTVDVTYKGHTDSDWNVTGTVTITNDGDLDAVINGYEDLLAGTDITGDLDCDFMVGDTLTVGDSFSCTYDEDVDSAIEGRNVFTVTTDRNLDPGYSGSANIAWGAPANETNKTIHVTDSVAGDLGTVTAPNNGQFTYSKDYSWADYGATACGDYTYPNTATITETGQSASATLKVNVQCMLSASAWAKGTGTPTVAEVRCFQQDGFSNWGWTNKIDVTGHYTWTLWAGAAMCDTSKGFNAGTVSFDYSTTTGNLTNIVYTPIAGVTFPGTNTYSGSAMYPKSGGKFTTAPGQYKLNTSKPTTWVIAHANVQYPDPNFGP
jgi:hypothetical protein